MSKKFTWRKFFTIIYRVVCLVALPLLTYILVEALNGNFIWLAWPGQTFLNCILILLISLIVTALVGKWWLGASLNFLFFLVLALVNFSKIQARAQPIFLAEFTLIKEVLALDYQTYSALNQINWPGREMIITAVIVIILVMLNWKFHFAPRLKIFTRFMLGLSSAAALAIFIFVIQFIELPFYTNITQLYQHNGLPMSLIYSHYLSKIEAPASRFSAQELNFDAAAGSVVYRAGGANFSAQYSSYYE